MEPISFEQQKANRLELAYHLETNVKDSQYYHQGFVNRSTGAMCAHAHAASIGMGGMEMYKLTPHHPQLPLRHSAQYLFGNDIIKQVFGNMKLSTRQEVINALREYQEKTLDILSYIRYDSFNKT
jgi:hypothetical protein